MAKLSGPDRRQPPPPRRQPQAQQQSQETTTTTTTKQTSLLSFWAPTTRPVVAVVGGTATATTTTTTTPTMAASVDRGQPPGRAPTPTAAYPAGGGRSSRSSSSIRPAGIGPTPADGKIVSVTATPTDDDDVREGPATPVTTTSGDDDDDPAAAGGEGTARRVSPPEGRRQHWSPSVPATEGHDDASTSTEDDEKDEGDDDEKDEGEDDDDGEDEEGDDEEEESPCPGGSDHGDDAAVPTTVGLDNPDPPLLSEYEMLRLRNIERNNARLAALGLIGGASSSAAAAKRRPPKRRRVATTTTAAVAVAPMGPTRRSTRNRTTRMSALSSGMAPATARSDDADATAGGNVPFGDYDERKGPGHVEAEEEYTVSPLIQYQLLTTTTTTATADSDVQNGTRTILTDSVQDGPTVGGEIPSTLTPVGPRLIPPKGLSAIYSLHFWDQGEHKLQTPQQHAGGGRWLAGAGKAGMVALWDTSSLCDAYYGGHDGSQPAVDPVFAWRGHNGRWISDARFLAGPASCDSNGSPGVAAPSRLVSAANDGTVCLWDLTAVSVSSGAPKLLHQTGKDLHSSGIFAMDVMDGPSPILCTGSKDRTVAVSSLDSLTGGGRGALWRSTFHTAKVGAVKLRGPESKLLASASDDGRVAVHDYRMDGMRAGGGGGGSAVVAQIEAHDRPHSVLWDPLRETVLVTAGLDRTIKVWDWRNLSGPLGSFQGHVPASTGRCTKIHRPALLLLSAGRAHRRPAAPPADGASLFVLTGGEGSGSISTFRWNRKEEADVVPAALFSRGRLPPGCGDAGCIAIDGDHRHVAVSVDDGEILLLRPTP